MRKSDLRESINKLLVPAKDHIQKQKSCECGPNKVSKREQMDRKN